MTLDDFTTAICRKINMRDSFSVTNCEDAVRKHYRTIYNALDWLDTQITSTATVIAGESNVATPAALDRVISLKANDVFLEPVSVSFLLQADPTIIERTGRPVYYREFTDPSDSDARKIQVYPTPTVNTPLYIVGKRKMPELALGTDEPIIRNIENALLCFGEGEMLERQRQRGSGEKAFAQGKAHLDAAQAIERDQVNRPRAIHALTVAGNSLGELAYAVCCRTNMWALDALFKIKEALRRNYQQIYDLRLWNESTVLANVDSDGSQLVLPDYFERVLSVLPAGTLLALMPTGINVIFEVAPNVFTQTEGQQLAFGYLTPVACAVLPPGNEKLTLVSSDHSDKTKVTITGESLGEEVREVVTLDGLSEVETSEFYDVPLTIAKDQTTGTITVRGATSSVVLQTLLPEERERKHIRLWFQPNNTTGNTCLVFGKRKIKPFYNDQDTPILRSIQMPLIELTVADLLGSNPGGAEALSKGQAALQTLVDLELVQGANERQVIPCVEPSYGLGRRWSSFIEK